MPLLLYGVLMAALQFYAPWWAFVPLAALYGTFARAHQGSQPINSVWRLAGGAACASAVVSMVTAAYFHFQGSGILAGRMAIMLKVQWPVNMFLLTGLLHALLSGFAAAAGAHLRDALTRAEPLRLPK